MTEIRKATGPEAARQRLERQAAREVARKLIEAAVASGEGHGPRFVLEVFAALFRQGANRVAGLFDATQTMRLIYIATVDIMPTWRSERASKRTEAEAVFKPGRAA